MGRRAARKIADSLRPPVPPPDRAHTTPHPKGRLMPTKYVVTTAAIALAVVLAHQHFAANGSPLKARIGN